ncbi:SHOCT domain-containing protein [Halorussus ruber]|uniref:SHOCT domain-containing protein n=1 Tax=Halorussus ruber TaxID=1126238 RepID=UPI001091D708|nr:SHOCT domain-containing protein [Halorussus ruber]
MATNAQLSRLLVVALALLLLLPVVTMLFAWPMMGMGWWMHGPVEGRPAGPGGFGGAAPTWMLGFWLVGLLLLVGVGYLLYRSVSGGTDDPALEELRRAYARGELTDEEYEERRERLE